MAVIYLLFLWKAVSAVDVKMQVYCLPVRLRGLRRLQKTRE
jgi:hypothetical protein